MNKKYFSPLVQLGFLQAGSVTIYCSLVGLLFWQGEAIFGNMPRYIGPVIFLLLFIVSALICALLVFYRPYQFFFADKKKEALDLVLYSTGWLFGFFVLLLLTAIFWRA